MKSKKNLMLQLTLVSFALNAISIFVSILSSSHKRIINVEAAYQKDRTLTSKENIINAQKFLYEDFENFPWNV